MRLFRMLFGGGEVIPREIEQMGLLAVKIAQMYAVRSDLLDVQRCRQLQGLYEQASPIRWSVAEGVLTESAPPAFWHEVRQIDPEPLAAASLGQVHRARHRDGTAVVVKLIKPSAAQEFERDLRAVRQLITVAVTLYPKLKRLADPVGTLETIARLTRTELDLRNEAKGTDCLREMRDGAPELPHLARLHFPRIYAELSSRQVLVSDYLPQQSVSKGLEAGEFTYDHLLQLFRTQGFYLFSHGRFHGDLHPGNVFYQDDHLWFLDNANVEQVAPEFTQGLLRFLVALGEQDYTAAAEVMQSLSTCPPHDVQRYQDKFHALYGGFQSGSTSLTTQMMETVKLSVHSGMEFPSGAFPVIKSLMYLDGIALRCAPEANLLQDVLQYTSDLQ